jgi:quinol monooxygenase YgiN
MRKLLFVLAVALAATACGQKPDGGNKVRMNIVATVVPENIDEITGTMNKMAAASVVEDGCEGYFIYRSTRNPSELYILESWTNAAAHEAHMQTEHFKTLMPTVSGKMSQAADRFEYTGTTGDDVVSVPKNESEMIRLNVFVETSPENLAEVIEGLNTLAAASRAETGCNGYEIYQSTIEPTKLIIVETWASDAVLSAHQQTPHYTTILPPLGEKMTLTLERFEF